MHFEYKPKMVCSTKIEFDLDNGILSNIRFTDGCDGNLKAVAKLLEGQSADFAISRLEGNTCGPRSTSCADQLTKAIRLALEQAD